MPKKKQRKPTSPPSEGSDDDIDDGFVTDPEQIFDILPQPFRLIDKTVSRIFDKAWEIIEGIEGNEALGRSKECLPCFDCGKPLHEYVQPSRMCSAPDGKYLFVAYSYGLAVVEALIGQSVATFDDSNAKNAIQMCACLIQQGFYLIGTLDNLGTAKLFCFVGDQIHLARVFSEESSKQHVATSIELSQEGNYVAIGWEIPQKESWLEIFKIPKDTWVKEAEAATAAPKSRKPTLADPQEAAVSDSSTTTELLKPAEDPDTASVHSSSSPSGSRPGSGQGPPPVQTSPFTKPSAVLRVRPPAPAGPCTATNCAAALKAVDSESNVIGTGNNHVLLSQYFQHSDMIFRALHEQQVKYLKEDSQDLTSTPSFHFLKPGKLVSSGLDSAPNKANSIAVWWSGGTQLAIYSLVKIAKDIEHKPDVVWPNAQQIKVSAISDCQSVLALGLDNGNVVVWDVHRGALLRVCTISSHGQITLLYFLPSGITSTYSDDQPPYLASPVPFANLAVACADGMFSILQCGVAYSPPPQPLLDGSAVEKEFITSVHTLLRIPQVISAVKRDGRMTLYDITSCTSISHVSLPVPYVIDPAVPPCMASDGQVVVLKGVCQDTATEEEQDSCVLFSFPLRSFPSLDKYWRTAREVEPYNVDNTVETTFNSLVQDRISSQGTRQIRMQERWSQFKGELKKMQADKVRADNTVWFTAQQSVYTRG